MADAGLATVERRPRVGMALLRLLRQTFVHLGVLNVSPFMMTLAMASIAFGLALFMTGGVPVYGMPSQFGATLGFGKLLGVPVPVYVTAVLVLGMYVLLNWTRMGRYFYAIGGNIKA